MKTASVNVCTLCVPCYNRCRYCLLSWDGKLLGADYDRCRDYAQRFHRWLGEHRPKLGFSFYFGYSMEHPRLLEAIDFAGSIGSPGGKFLQLDGLRFRSSAETRALLEGMKAHGIKTVDLTLYGTKDYHDKFAARQGDFDYLMTVLEAANRVGLGVTISIPVTEENADQVDPLLETLGAYEIDHLFCFVPHGEGRGASLEKIRLTGSRYDSLSPRVKAYFNREKFRTEGEWLSQGSIRAPENRMLCLNLTPENLEHFESLDFGETIAYLEKLDDDYYSVIPDFQALARLYGDPTGEKLYSQRDLYLTYQRRYIADRKLDIYDINDERHCFSRRY